MIYLSQLAVAVVLGLLGVCVFRAQPRNPVHLAFAAQTLTFTGWVLGIAGLQRGQNLDFWFAIAFGFASLIPAAFVFFSYCYPTPPSIACPLYIRIIFLFGGIFALLSFFSNSISYGAELTAAGLARKHGPLYPLFAIYFVAATLIGIWVFVRKWSVSRGLSRAQFHYLGVGIIGGFLGGTITNLMLPLLTGRSTHSWIGPYFSVFYVGLVAHAIIRHRLMDLRVFIHRSLTIALAILFSATPTALLVILFSPRLLTQLDVSELGLVLVAVAIVTVIIPIARDAASRLLDNYVYRTRANYQRTVREASHMLTRVLNLDELLAFISATVIRSTAVEGAALYLLKDGVFCCAISGKWGDTHHFNAPLLAPLEVITQLKQAQQPVLTEELIRRRAAPTMDLCHILTRDNWSLLLPVLSEDALIAFIVVGPKLSGDPFYQQDLDLLMTLANQAGVAIKNAQLYAAVVVSNQYLDNIVATIESGVIAIDARGEIAMLNPAAERLTGLSVKSARRAGIMSLPDCLLKPLSATVDDGQPRSDPEVILKAVESGENDPEIRPLICATSPVRDPAGVVIGAVAVFSDLTPLKELELERRRAERLTYFQVLAAGIAHEIKNPLVAIKTFAQLLPRRQDDSRFLEEFGRIAAREIDRMQTLVDRLQTLSRPTAAPQSTLDVRMPLVDALECLQASFDDKGIHSAVTLGAAPCIIVGNHEELEQLFLNLLINAQEATPKGGEVTAHVNKSETHIVVEICDTGPGMEPELLERALEPFFTTKPRGSGLGLAISVGIAEAHGGTLRAENRPTGGALFAVEFPLSGSAPSTMP
jgi:PAS domain S-box-containing protein